MPIRLFPLLYTFACQPNTSNIRSENQSAVIQKYAEARGFQIVATYSDPAKSGLVLRRRFGLQQLLRDVVGAPPYRAILVYDVSRWGRFQDTDESAHYEFLCKAAGVPVHYCAESFVNDGSLPSLHYEDPKRTMAAEYSRELSVKVLAGQKRIATSASSREEFRVMACGEC